MFGEQFYPTPPEVAEQMLSFVDVQARVVLEPSAGKGDLVTACLEAGAHEVMACEIDSNLRRLLPAEARFLRSDCLELKAHEVSHVQACVMNPPFNRAVEHILHLFEVLPAGCQIVALCNATAVDDNRWRSNSNSRLHELIREHGTSIELGACFASAERQTDVQVALVHLTKPGVAPEVEFEGFYMGPDQVEAQGEGLIQYSFARDIVNRFVEACRIYDDQLVSAGRLRGVLDGFYGSDIGFQTTENGIPVLRNDFRKKLQKAAWMYVIERMELTKMATKQLRADINTFVEQQTMVPFTMRNIYRMCQIVACTNDSRMDRAIEEAFDKLTKHYPENRHAVEGWAHNSQYLFTKYFILPYICDKSWSGGGVDLKHGGNLEEVDDLIKALCFITGENYEVMSNPLKDRWRLESGVWLDWGFFEAKFYKKGTGHFKFKNPAIWRELNVRIGRIKGYVLPERL